MYDRQSELELRIQPLRQRLLAHPLYSRLESEDEIHTFMASHVLPSGIFSPF